MQFYKLNSAHLCGGVLVCVSYKLRLDVLSNATSEAVVFNPRPSQLMAAL